METSIQSRINLPSGTLVDYTVGEMNLWFRGDGLTFREAEVLSSSVKEVSQLDSF